MIAIKDTIVSRDLIDVLFSCDLDKCKGACCVEGDSGPPLTQEEERTIKKLYPLIKKYMKPESMESAERYGLSFTDQEHELVAMIHENSGECIFALFKLSHTCCYVLVF